MRTSQNNWWTMNCRVLYTELCVPVIPPVVLTGTQSLLYCTLQFIFHQLFWLVRRVRCTVRYSSYSTSCSDWYAEFVVLHATIHIPPVVLNGTQSSVQHNELCVPVGTTGGLWTVEYCTPNSAYQWEQLFIFHQLFWLVRRVRCTAR
jgi:hypothetical protein